MVSVATLMANSWRVTDNIDSEVRWLVHGMLPVGGRAMLVAPPKAGKTTTVVDLVWALASGDSFLTNTTSLPQDRSVVVVDLEMTEAQAASWHRKRAQSFGQDVTDRVIVHSLKGAHGQADFSDSEIVDTWIDYLRAVHAGVLVIDCLAPLIAAAGLDENVASDVQRLLIGIDRIAKEAGLLGVVTVHHAGKGAGTRGSSALDGSGDSIWRLNKQKGRGRMRVVVTGRDTSGTYYGRLTDTGHIDLIGWEDIEGVPDKTPPSESSKPAGAKATEFAGARGYVMSKLEAAAAEGREIKRRDLRGNPQAKDAINELIEEGVIVETGSVLTMSAA